MDEDQNALNEAISGDNEDVENGGVGAGDAEEQGNAQGDQEFTQGEEPYSIKKRLGMQAKKHAREMRQMQEHIMRMQAQIGGDSAVPPSHANSNPFPSPGQPSGQSMSEEEKIQHAVRLALGAKDHQDRQAKDAERQAHVYKQYQRLNDEFDQASDKYDDFEDVVRGEDTPFTPHMRDALLLVENPAEVAYKLGKNKAELKRISDLHPLDQAREVNRLSFALRSGNDGKSHSHAKAQPLGNMRVNPSQSSGAITDKTPAAIIRARMKAGTFK